MKITIKAHEIHINIEKNTTFLNWLKIKPPTVLTGPKNDSVYLSINKLVRVVLFVIFAVFSC